MELRATIKTDFQTSSVLTSRTVLNHKQLITEILYIEFGGDWMTLVGGVTSLVEMGFY